MHFYYTKGQTRNQMRASALVHRAEHMRDHTTNTDALLLVFFVILTKSSESAAAGASYMALILLYAGYLPRL